MNYALLLVPLVASLASWLMIRFAIKNIFRPHKPIRIAGFTFQGVLPKARPAIAAQAAHAISREILQSAFINEKLSGPETLEKAMPVIETHIDNFLNHKLKEAIPVISMFIGEKITNQLKELFLEELKELFPSIMSQFIGNLSQSGDLEAEIAVKLQAISTERTEVLFYERFGKAVRKAEITFAVGGLLTGIIQLLLTLMILS